MNGDDELVPEGPPPITSDPFWGPPPYTWAYVTIASIVGAIVVAWIIYIVALVS